MTPILRVLLKHGIGNTITITPVTLEIMITHTIGIDKSSYGESSCCQTQTPTNYATSTGHPVTSSQYQNASNFGDRNQYYSTPQYHTSSQSNAPSRTSQFNTQNANDLAGYSNYQQSCTQVRNNNPGCTCVGQREKVQVEKYDDQKLDLEDYLTHFEMVANLKKWNDREKAQRLVINLRGSAQTLLGGLTLNQLNYFNALKGAAPRFPSEDKERLLSEILRSCQN
jgi:hypothetical protein